MATQYKVKALFIRVSDAQAKLLYKAMDICNILQCELEVIDNYIPHKEFIERLHDYDYFLDLKGFTTKDVISVSAIEALQCGCIVVTDDYVMIKDFDFFSFDDYIALYQELVL